MKVNLKEIKFYFLTCNNEKRKENVFEKFKEYDITEVNPVSINTGISKLQSGSTGFSRMIDIGIINQDRTKPFQPFMLMEDDVNKYRDFPEEIDIPDNTDLLYTGLSTWGMTNTEVGSPGTICCSEVHGFPHLVRVKNMLALHGIIVCSITGLLTFQKSLIEDFYRNRGWDMTIAESLPYINAYAMCIPLVYQYKLVGGQELATKFEITNNTQYKDFVRELPNEWLNTTNMTIKTKFTKIFQKKGVYHFNCENIKEQTLKYMKEDKINLKNIIFFQRKDNQEENQKNIFYIDSYDICQVIKDNALQGSSIDTIVINGSDNILFGNILQCNKQLIQDNIKHILVYNVNDASYINKSITILDNVEIENNSMYNLHNNEILIKVIN
jgi:hypothetical protein|uniref:Uncharacterized protein n=1 Tax=viral metagenome TaxID=1070528 RepID=A0A6C0IL85_9ZZZZ